MKDFKLYELVSVQEPMWDGSYIGQILSRPIPGDTYMVRQVPGHYGTLVELSAERLSPTIKHRWVHYAIVKGLGTFPTDMLRYDHAVPVNFHLEDTVGGVFVMPKVGHDTEGLLIAHCTTNKTPRWTPDRWRSFTWSLNPVKSEKIEEVR